MFVWLGRKQQVRRKQGGRRERLRCPECQATANFTECELVESLSAFSLLELDSHEETVFRCGECGELCELREDDELAALKKRLGTN